MAFAESDDAGESESEGGCGGDWRQPRRCLAGAWWPRRCGRLYYEPTSVAVGAPPRGGEAGVAARNDSGGGGPEQRRWLFRAAAPPHEKRGGAQCMCASQQSIAAEQHVCSQAAAR